MRKSTRICRTYLPAIVLYSSKRTHWGVRDPSVRPGLPCHSCSLYPLGCSSSAYDWVLFFDEPRPQATHMAVTSCPILGFPHFRGLFDTFTSSEPSTDMKRQSTAWVCAASTEQKAENREVQHSSSWLRPSTWGFLSSQPCCKDTETPRRTVLHSPIFLMCFRIWLTPALHSPDVIQSRSSTTS